MQGAARVVYDSLGTATTYSKDTYEIINEDGTQVINLTWELSVNNDYSGLPTLTESNIKVNANVTDADAVYITKYKIKPSSYVPPEIPPVAIIAKQGNIIYWSQPILITQNTWFNESINEWTNVLSINQQNDGTILAPLLIAGTKTSNNLFSGVTVGQLAIGSKKVNGVYGFAQGKARFWLNEGAEFFIGNGENKNIYFDANGKFSIVAKSFDFRTPEEIQNKLILSSTNQEFQIGNENSNSYLKFYTPEGGGQKKFEIKANDFEFDSTNYNGFSMRVGKEGFYTGTKDEYISFEKQQREDGNQDYYRTLKIQAKNFELATDYITLSSKERYLLIKKDSGLEEKSDERVRVGAIKKRDGAIVYGLDIYGGALRVYTKNEENIPKLWIQDSNIYLSGRITNDVVPEDWNENYIPHTWMTMGYPDSTEGEDRGSGFRIFNTDIYSSTIPVFKVWPGYINNEYNAMIISGYKKIKLCPYVIPNNADTNLYSSYLEVSAEKQGGSLWGNWSCQNLCGGEIQTTQSFRVLNKTSQEVGLHLWADNNKVGVINAPNGNLSLRSKSTVFITGTNSGGTLHGTWSYGTLSGGNITASSLYAGTSNNQMWNSNDNNFVIVSKNTKVLLCQGSDNNTKLEVNSSGGSLYGTWNINTIKTSSNIVIETTSGAHIDLKPSTSGYGWMFGSWSIDQSYSGSGTAVTSDINKKNSINTFTDKYDVMFNLLRPVIFKYNNGTSNRMHSGFIAQEVNQALELSQLTTQEFAGLVITQENETPYGSSWMLRYEEFIPLNTWQIQKLKTRVTELENEIKEIKQRYEI